MPAPLSAFSGAPPVAEQGGRGHLEVAARLVPSLPTICTRPQQSHLDSPLAQNINAMTTPPHESTSHLFDNQNAPMSSLESHLHALESALDDLNSARRVPPSLRLGITNATSDLNGWEYSIQRLTGSIIDLGKQDALGTASELVEQGVEPIDRNTAHRAILHSRQDNILPPVPHSQVTIPFTTEDKLLPTDWTSDHEAPYTLRDLKLLVRSYNNPNGGVRIRFWAPARSKSSTSTRPAALHVLVDKVIQAFILLDHSSTVDSAGITVDRVSCFAPHEAKPPSGNSTYNVYQSITRYFSVLLSTEPELTPRNILDILLTYRTLFRDKCGFCGTELSADGRVPPVGRIWKRREGTTDGSDAGAWTPRHVQCMSAFY
ncbi:hypothetical protein CALVIDRAFT_540319 [Calocera viscosa TUFC12733]|uniref:Mediator complex subunit 27 n=1 Tax=Calocera viscosa (strain TUFC12733) TaxID=1330018 RepID=A0A167IXV3_CALVF|nr:hypothetical protein CALVIDRAFT_540319 [Calocera viscosa TUFC12733]